jgi:2-iminobutanoate/2-iminopropanoate deaminase
VINRSNPPVVAPPAGRYSHVATVPAGHDLVFLAGQIGATPDGALAGPDAESQARQIFANIEALLGSVGAGPGNVVKLVTLVAGTEHIDGYRAASEEVFDRWYPAGDWPPNTLAVVAALAAPALVVEIEAVVAVPSGTDVDV